MTTLYVIGFVVSNLVLHLLVLRAVRSVTKRQDDMLDLVDRLLRLEENANVKLPFGAPLTIPAPRNDIVELDKPRPKPKPEPTDWRSVRPVSKVRYS